LAQPDDIFRAFQFAHLSRAEWQLVIPQVDQLDARAGMLSTLQSDIQRHARVTARTQAPADAYHMNLRLPISLS